LNILVTGAAGFIGFHVARKLLERGDGVIGLDNLNAYYDPDLKLARIAELEKLSPDRFKFVRADFSDREDLDRTLDKLAFDRIVHLGAQAGVRYSIEDPGAYAASNLVGHLNMLEIGRARAVRHLVYASSSSVYGNTSELPLRVEQRVDHPISLYAASKKADELMSEAYSHLYRLPQTGLRFFTVYGPWGRPDMAVWIFTRKILAGEPISVFNEGRMRRDFTFVDDVVAALLPCLDAPPADDDLPKPGGSTAPHRIYNIGNSRPEELTRLIEIIEHCCGRTAIRHLEPMQPGDVTATYADIEPIRADFGFDPSTPLEKGVPIFVEWFRGHHGL